MSAVAPKLREQAYQRFTRGVIAREIRAGQFVTQRELAEITGMPLGAIRELIPRLEAEGLIQTVPQRGMQVAHVDVDLIRNAFQLRLILEREAAARFAETAPVQAFDELEDAHRAILGAAAKGVTPSLVLRAQAVDDGMHASIVDALRNPLVSDAFRVNFIRVRLIRQAGNSIDASLVVPVMEEHLEVIAALRSRDPQRAAAAIDRHVGGSRDRALGLPWIPMGAATRPADKRASTAQSR